MDQRSRGGTSSDQPQLLPMLRSQRCSFDCFVPSCGHRQQRTNFKQFQTRRKWDRKSRKASSSPPSPAGARGSPSDTALSLPAQLLPSQMRGYDLSASGKCVAATKIKPHRISKEFCISSRCLYTLSEQKELHAPGLLSEFPAK